METDSVCGIRAEAESSKHVVTTAERHRMIAEAAYCLAERRGFADGDALSDWLVAEAEVDKRLVGPDARTAAV